MEINPKIIMKNLGTFTNAYGLDPKSKLVLKSISVNNGTVASIGVLLRDPITKMPLLSCQFPAEGDITNDMLWVPINNRAVENLPVLTREATPGSVLKNVWKKLKDKMNEDHFYLIHEGAFTLKVHHSLCKHGVVEHYTQEMSHGYIRRSRKGIYFKKGWCISNNIQKGNEVSFIPVISRKGLQARAVTNV